MMLASLKEHPGSQPLVRPESHENYCDHLGDLMPRSEKISFAAEAGYESDFRKGNAELNPVIVIPGIMGSRLVSHEGTNSVWGDFSKGSEHPDEAEKLRQLALPMDIGKTVDKLLGESTSDGSMRRVKGSIAGLPVSINVYDSLMTAMGVGEKGMGGGLKRLDDYVDDRRHQVSAFEFGYDWRRSLDESARDLALFIRQVTKFVQLQRDKNDPVKLDIVAHSMGGLIARYFLQYGDQLLPGDGSLPHLNWAGTAQVESVVIIGTPNGGSLFALESLLAGFHKNLVIPDYDPMVLGTMPAIYQLLPRVRHRTFSRTDARSVVPDFLSTEFWIEMNWGLADDSRDEILSMLLPGIDGTQRRREVALDHLDKCLDLTRTMQNALDIAATPPHHLKRFLFLGDSIATPLVATAKPGDRALTIVTKGAGDGTVPRASVLLDERLTGRWSQKLISPLNWDNVIFLSSDHLGLTKDPLFVKNILYSLLERA